MSKLHEFDLELCEYARANLARCLDDPAILKQLERLTPEFKSYILAQRKFGKTKTPTSGLLFLLNDVELMELKNIAEMVEPFTAWLPYQELHNQATLCTGEITRRVAPAEGQHWASDSSQFMRRLEANGVSVADGISILREWLWELRRYKEAMGEKKWLPRPDGQFPTPTSPTPDVPEVTYAGDSPQEDILRMRKAIQATENGRKAKPDVLIKAAQINVKRGREALRFLEKVDEYEGFFRPKPSRYS